MLALRVAVAAAVAVAIIVQLWRVPRLWALVFMFIVLFPKVALALVPGNTTPLRVDDFVIAVVLGVWIVRESLSRRPPVPASPLTLFVILYLFVALTSTLLGYGAMRTGLFAGTFHFLRLIEYLLLYYFFYRSIRASEVSDVLHVFRTTWLIVAFVWAAQHWTASLPSLEGPPVDWSSYFPSFSASYDFGGYAMLATLVCYALWTDRKTRDTMTTVGLLFGLYVLINADSRASLLGLIVAIVFDLFFRLRVRTAFGLVAAGAALPYLINSQKMTKLLEEMTEFVTTFDINALQRTFFADPSIEMRLRNWQILLERWREVPLLGDGLGAYLESVRIYNMPGSPDGWYIRTLAETGLIGLLAFVMLIGAILWTLLMAYNQEPRALQRTMVYAGTLALIATAVNGLLIDTFVSYKIMGVFWMLMGVATRVAVDTMATQPDRSPSPEWLVRQRPIET